MNSLSVSLISLCHPSFFAPQLNPPPPLSPPPFTLPLQILSSSLSDAFSGAAYHEHRIDSLDHAVELTNAAEAAVEEGVKTAKRIDDAVALLHRILQMPTAKLELWNVKDLKRKYCHKVLLVLLCIVSARMINQGIRSAFFLKCAMSRRVAFSI